jgi:hypothetical protein
MFFHPPSAPGRAAQVGLRPGRAKGRAAISAPRPQTEVRATASAFRNACVENKGGDWVRRAKFSFTGAAFPVKAGRDGNGIPHPGLSIAWGLAAGRKAD